MRQLNVPRKLTAIVQIWVSVVLLFIAAGLSLAPIITLQTATQTEKLGEMLRELELPGEELLDELPETVDISVVKIVKSVFVITNVVIEKQDVFSKNQEEPLLESEEGKDTLVVALALATAVASDFEIGGSDAWTGILPMVISLLVLLVLLMMTFAIPVMLLMSALSALFSALFHLKSPEKVSAKIGRKLPGFISIPLMVMLFQCVIPGMSYGSGIMGIFIVTIFAAVLGLVISRMRSYSLPAFRYLNIVQGMSVVGIVGFVMFFFNLIQTNVFSNFLRGKLMQCVIAVMKNNSNVEVDWVWLIDFALIIVYVGMALGAVKYLEKSLRRLVYNAATTKKGKFRKDSLIVRAVFMLTIFVIPKYVMGQKHFRTVSTSTQSVSDGSLLELNAEESKALTMVLVGIIVMLVAEIALIVLKNVFCKNAKQTNLAPVVEDAATEEKTETAQPEGTEETDELNDDTEAEDSVEEFAEETTEKSTEVSTEKSTEESTEESAEETTEESTEDISEECSQ